MRAWAMILAAMLAGGAGAQAPEVPPPVLAAGPVDYALPASWLCRPGVDDGSCSVGLDAVAVYASGARTPVSYQPAARPPIDCFYVYPTVSRDPSMFSDMAAGPEERATVHAQAARLGARCRLFAPIYRQVTSAGLGYELRHPSGRAVDLKFDPAYRDVLAAWRSYLARDNKGRGVVLVGHSQGAILLKRLIAEELDGKPTQGLLVAAYLAGNYDLTAASFRAIKPCRSSNEAGCVVAWSSYPEDQAGPRFFGNGQKALCTNPGALAGGRGPLKAILPKPALAPAGDPPFVEAVGQLSAECVADPRGNVLRIRVEPGRHADLLRAGLQAAVRTPSWGLHALDIALAQGNMLDLIGDQTAAWLRRR